MIIRKIDKAFDKGLFYLSKEEHIIIKKALAFYIEKSQHKNQKDWDDIMFLYGDLDRNAETELIDKDWL